MKIVAEIRMGYAGYQILVVFLYLIGYNQIKGGSVYGTGNF